MPDDNELEQRDGESPEDYITRLQTELGELFEKHIAENEGQPLFASDIKDLEERKKWEERQLKQWEARRKILAILKTVDATHRKKEEINIADYWFLFNEDSDLCDAAKSLELRQRWFTTNGKTYLDLSTSYREAQYYNRLFPTSVLTKSMVTPKPELPYATEVQNKDFRWADLFNEYLIGEELPNSCLQYANLKEAQLEYANLKGSNLAEAKLQGANFNGAVIAGSVLKGNGPKTDDAGTGQTIQEIDDRSANFAYVKFSPEWRGPKWIAPIAWLLHLGKKQLAWRKWMGRKKWGLKIQMDDYPEPKRWYAGSPTTFIGVDTSRMDASKNPGLKRYIEDEQYIEDFKEKHPVIYWFWAMSSDCGRCLSLWAFWSLVFATAFAAIYTIFPWMIYVDNINTEMPHPHFLTNLYFSIVTFTTLGFGDVQANNLWGAMVIGLEVVLGYFFLGGLVAILASKLARRA